MAYRPGHLENGVEVERRNVIVIGICGASGSGKSTLARLLSERLNCPYRPLDADRCFHKMSSWPKCHHSFPGKRSQYCEESAHAIDHKKLARQVSAVAGALRAAPAGPVPASEWAVRRTGGEPLGPPGEGRTYMIVEGFKIFAEEELVRCCDRLIWLEVDRETCFQRAARDRGPQHRPATREEYEGHRWPVHLEFRDQMLANAEAHSSELIVLANGGDGEEATAALVDQAMHRLHSGVDTSSSLAEFPGPQAPVDRHDEVFKVTLMDSEGRDPQNRYLVVETVSGRLLVCGKVFGVCGWFAPKGHKAIPGFQDPDPEDGAESAADSLVVRWALVSDRAFSIMGLANLAFRKPDKAFEAVRDHGKEYRLGSNPADEDELPESELDRLFASLDVLPAVTMEDVKVVDEKYRRFGACCRVIKNVLSPELCEFFKAFMDNSGKLKQNKFQGLDSSSKFWLSLRVKSTTDKLADLIFQRMEPVVRDLVIHVDDEDRARQRLVVDPAASDEPCPEALQIGASGEWTPYGFNPTVRFAKYNPGGKFCKHIDAMYTGSFYFWTSRGVDRCGELGVLDPPAAETRVPAFLLRRWESEGKNVGRFVRDGLLREASARTLFSCLFYLHDSTSGATNFLRIPARFSDFKEITTPANAAVSPEAPELLTGVQPRAGSALLFFQPGLTHDGAAVAEGDKKYFFRTDLVFLRKGDHPRAQERSA